MDRAGHRARISTINKIEDLKGKRVAVTRGTDPHIFLVRALLSVKLTEKDITPVLLQHPDGKTALIRGDVDAWAGLDPMMAQAEVEDGAKLFYRNKEANTWGILNVREEFLKDHPDLVKRVLAVYEEARKYSLANYDEDEAASSSPRPSCRTRWSTSSSRSAPSSPTARSARRSATRSWRPASRCSRPA